MRSNPFKSLESYHEKDKDLYFGRNSEVVSLFNIIDNNQLTILHGKSGSGKSSLVNAGLIPMLRENYFPVSIRTINLTNAKDCTKFTFKELRSETKKHEIEEIDLFKDDEIDGVSLWEFFHRIKFSKDNSLTPVIIFDQFEELFNYGVDEEGLYKANVQDFINNLACLIEDYAPANFDIERGGKEKYRRFIDETPNCRIVFVLKSEYLSELESLCNLIPKICLTKKVKLNSLSYEKALDVLNNAGSDFFEDDCKIKILNNIGNIKTGTDQPDVRIEPFLLSLFCYEMVETIKNTNRKLSSSDIRESDFTNYLRNFYKKATDNISEETKFFIEDKLVVGNSRIPYSYQSAVTKHNIDEADLLKLEKKLLLRKYSVSGNQLVEIIHDKLIDIIKEGYEERQLSIKIEEEKKEAIKIQKRIQIRQRNFITRIALVVMSVGILVIVFLLFQANESRKIAQQQSERAQMESERATFEKNKSDSLAQVARSLQEVAEREKDNAIDEKNKVDSLREIAQRRAMENQRFKEAAIFHRDADINLLLSNNDELIGDFVAAAKIIFQELYKSSLDANIDFNSFVEEESYLEDLQTKSSDALFEKSILHYTNSIEFNKHYSTAYDNLANAYLQDAKFDSALMVYKQACQNNPRNIYIFKDLLDFIGSDPKYYENSEYITFKNKLLEEAMAVEVDDPNYYLTISIDYIGREEFDAAKVPLEKITNHSQESSFVLGALYLLNQPDPLYDKAEEVIYDLVVQYPENRAAYDLLGMIYVFQKRYDEAILIHEKYLEIDPEDKDVVATIELLHNYSSAKIAEYEEKINEDPLNATYWNEIGKIYYRREDDENAVIYYYKAISLDSTNATYHSNLALSLAYLKKTKEAENEYLRAAKLEPNNALHWEDLGIISKSNQNYDLAETAYFKSLELKPENDEIWNDLGLMYYDQAKTEDENNNSKEADAFYEKAIENYKKAIELNPKNATYRINVGLSYVSLNDIEKAKNEYEMAVKLDPDNTDYLYALKIIEAYKNEDKSLVEKLTKELDSDPTNDSLWNKLGLEHYNLKNDEKAVENYQKAISLNPENDIYYSNLALPLIYLGKNKEAEEAYQNAINIDPQNDLYYNALGNLFYRQEMYDKSLFQFQQANKIKPHEAVYYYNIAVSLKGLGQLKKATKNMESAVRLDSTSSTYFDELGSLLFMTEKPNEAFNVYKLAIEKFPDNSSLHNNFAWDIVSYHSDSKNLIEAEKHALISIELDSLNNGQRAYNWDTLAEIYLKLEKINDAYNANEKAKSLDVNGEISQELDARDKILKTKMNVKRLD